MSFWDKLTKKLAIDPGTEKLRISDGKKIIFNEPAKISINTNFQKVSGIGLNAISTEKIIYPVNNVIQYFYAFENLLRGATTQAIVEKKWFQSSFWMYLLIPTTVTEVEKRAYRDSAEHAGASAVNMLFQSCAAAIGLNILFKKRDFVLVDFSASKVEITIFINSLIKDGQSIPIGTWKIRKVIKNYIFRTTKEILTNKELDTIINHLPNDTKYISFRGKKILKDEVIEILEKYFYYIEDEILALFERVSSDSQIHKALANGIFFTGGGSQIKWLADRIAKMIKLNYVISPNPTLDNINGISYVMNNPEKFKDYLMV